jgi:hypothetical protein
MNADGSTQDVSDLPPIDPYSTGAYSCAVLLPAVAAAFSLDVVPKTGCSMLALPLPRPASIPKQVTITAKDFSFDAPDTIRRDSSAHVDQSRQ